MPRNLIRAAVLVIGGYVLYTNRFRVQRLLESAGIKTPWLNGNVADAVQSGAAILSGSVDRGLASAGDTARKTA